MKWRGGLCFKKIGFLSFQWGRNIFKYLLEETSWKKKVKQVLEGLS